ncbi:hypothetical protein AAZV13_20G086000 [Glycine max]
MKIELQSLLSWPLTIDKELRSQTKSQKAPQYTSGAEKKTSILILENKNLFLIRVVIKLIKQFQDSHSLFFNLSQHQISCFLSKSCSDTRRMLRVKLMFS